MQTKSPYLIPVAILLAGVVLSLTIYTVRTGGPATLENRGDIALTRPVQIDDHIMGTPDAAVTVIEYSDIDCEYCKSFQQVMEQVMAEYGPSGKVAWVYRHFPIVDAHPDSGTHAEAAECAAEQGGANTFWRFIDALNTSASGANQFDPTKYGTVIATLGLDESVFEACRASDRFIDRVSSDFENALQIGADSAPFSVIQIRGSEPIVISGFVPYDSMKEVIESALSKVIAP